MFRASFAVNNAALVAVFSVLKRVHALKKSLYGTLLFLSFRAGELRLSCCLSSNTEQVFTWECQTLVNVQCLGFSPFPVTIGSIYIQYSSSFTHSITPMFSIFVILMTVHTANVYTIACHEYQLCPSTMYDINRKMREKHIHTYH